MFSDYQGVNAGWIGRAGEAKNSSELHWQVTNLLLSLPLYATQDQRTSQLDHLYSSCKLQSVRRTSPIRLSYKSHRRLSMLKPSSRISASLVRTMSSAPGYSLRQRRFAPLNPELSAKSDAPPLKGIVFDVDGTLWLVLFLSCLF